MAEKISSEKENEAEILVSQSAKTMAASSSSCVQTKTTPLLSSLNQIGSVKLDRTNFRLWNSLVLPALRGHRMEGFVLGIKTCPPEFITDELGIRIHPEFDEWMATDATIFSWLLSTMTADVASQLLHCKTSAQLWKAVNDLMSAHSKSRVTMYKYDLQQTHKGSSSIDEYLSKMKSIADNLSMAGSPISESDLITQVLAGLDSEYTPIVIYLTDKDNLTWIDLHSRLLTFERHLEHISSVNSLNKSFANVAVSAIGNGNSGNSSDVVMQQQANFVSRPPWRSNNQRNNQSSVRGGRGGGREEEDLSLPAKSVKNMVTLQDSAITGLINHILMILTLPKVLM